MKPLMVHWHCYKVSRAGSDFPEPGHEDHHWGKIKEKKTFLAFGSVQNASAPLMRVSICSEGGIYCSSSGEFTAELPKWQDRQENTAPITGEKKNVPFYDYSLARTMWHPPTCSD